MENSYNHDFFFYYEASSKRLELRLSKLWHNKPDDPFLSSYRFVDNVAKRQIEFIGKRSLYSWMHRSQWIQRCVCS